MLEMLNIVLREYKASSRVDIQWHDVHTEFNQNQSVLRHWCL